MIICTYIIFICLVTGSVIVKQVLADYLLSSRLRLVNNLLFLVFLVSLVLLARDTYRKWNFLRNDMKTYADAWDIEELVIKGQKSKRANNVTLKYIPPIGRIDGFKDNKGWVLSCVAGYYGLMDVRIK